MNKFAAAIPKSQTWTGLVLRGLIALYAAARVLQIPPDRVPMPIVVALHVLPPAVFALIHGSGRYRWRGILAFCALGLAVGNTIENVGVRPASPSGAITLPA